jgi:hypothetical protein
MRGFTLAKELLQNLIFSFYKDKRVILFIVILFYLSLSFILLGHYLHVFNDDSISYLTIANEYEDGNFSAAINGYWSPLFSWLMVPFFIFSSSVLGDLIAARLISVIIGLFTLMGVYLLINNLDFDRKTMIATLFVMIPVVLSFVFFLLTPDLLLTCCLIYYIAFLTDSDYYSKLKLGLLSGFAGGLAFLSKSYVFVFFPVHFILSNIYYLKSRPLERRSILKNLFIGLVVFLIIAGAWSSAISLKYEKFTFSTAGSYNYELYGPDSKENPVLSYGLLKPPNDQAISAWEDPSYFPMQEWSPFESSQSLVHLLQNFIQNIGKLYNDILLRFSVLSWLIIILGIYLTLKTKKGMVKDKLTIITGTILLYPLAYCIIFISERYCWPIYILLIVLGLYSLKTLFEMKLIHNTVYTILIVLISFSFIISPVLDLNDSYDGGEGYYILSESLRQTGVSGNVASDDNYVVSDKLCYYLNCNYYGGTNLSGPELNSELLNNNINYYFVWKEETIILNEFEESQDFNNKYLRVYKKIT